MSKSRKSPKSLEEKKIKALKAMAVKIDLHEASAIRKRGKEVFARHARLRTIVAELKNRRLKRKMSLSDLASLTGIAKPNLSRLENDAHLSPTLDTLDRYARAVGMKVRIELALADAA